MRRLRRTIELSKAMPLQSSTDPASSDFARNAETMRALVAELRGRLSDVAGGVEKLLGAATRKLLYEFHVTGSFADPEIHPIAAPVLTKNAAVVFGKMLHEMKEHELLDSMDEK